MQANENKSLTIEVDGVTYERYPIKTHVVTDADDGSPLPGVSVVIKGTHLGTATDAMGKYSIRIDGKAVLVFTFIGMQTQEIPVNNRSVVNVNMR